MRNLSIDRGAYLREVIARGILLAQENSVGICRNLKVSITTDIAYSIYRAVISFKSDIIINCLLEIVKQKLRCITFD